MADGGWRMADVGLRNEGRAQQTRSRQGGEALRISQIGLAPRHGFDVPRVHHPRGDAHVLQRRIRAFPVNAGALHDHHLGTKRFRPLHQRPSVALEAAKFARLHSDVAISLLGHGAGADLGLVHVQPDERFIACLSGCFPSVNLRSFPEYVNQACVSDITAGVHETFPG